MCGLAGVAVIGGANLGPEHDALLSSMSHAVAHRGPDGDRIERDGPVGLVFRRLALVGPTSGDQPLYSADGTVSLIANGEVYNHRDIEAGALRDISMRTRSDCEVLAHLLARRGVHFLDEAYGMFAIAAHDRGRRRLVFARDRFGIKPLYWTRVGDLVLFASEIKALFTHPDTPREVDWASALADQALTTAAHLTLEPVISWFRGIHVVPAGTVVTIDLDTGRSAEHEYWSLPDLDGTGDLSDAELVDAYGELLDASVRDCATADAEIGLFLSGGVDSAVVAASAARAGAIVHTFTVLSGSTLANGDAFFGHRVAAELGLPNHHVVFPAADQPGVQEYRNLLWLLETPLCGAEHWYKFESYRYAKHVRPELRGMLLGQASDEYNGGYATVFGDNWSEFEENIVRMARAGALTTAPPMGAWWNVDERPLVTDELLRPFGDSLLADPYAAYVAWKHRTIQQYNCWHEDRTAAGNGVEARVPFLDHRLIELTARIPRARRKDLLWDKRILRDAARLLLPDDVADRPKVPFFHGDGVGFTYRSMVRMLAQDGGALVEEAVSSPGGARYLQADALRSAMRRLASDPEPNGVEYVLRLTNLGLLDAMMQDVPSAPTDHIRPAIRTALRAVSWERDVANVRAAMHRVEAPGPEDVLEIADHVEVLDSRQLPGALVVAVDGELAYLVDPAEDPAWRAFLHAIDGVRTLAELLRAAEVDRGDVEPLLRQSLDAGLLTVRPAALGDGADAATDALTGAKR
jgi:asparagine synthase (glutamine-hydrolysing)